jgi:hypothetical protein
MVTLLKQGPVPLVHFVVLGLENHPQFRMYSICI